MFHVPECHAFCYALWLRCCLHEMWWLEVLPEMWLLVLLLGMWWSNVLPEMWLLVVSAVVPPGCCVLFIHWWNLAAVKLLHLS